jgi:hypothetical protein
MTKPKTWADLVRSLDVDWPPHQPTSLLDLVAGARAVEWDFTHWCYVSGYDARDPGARNMFECLLAYGKPASAALRQAPVDPDLVASIDTPKSWP